MDGRIRSEGAPSLNRLRTVLRNLGWLLASRGVLAVLSLLYLGIATRTLGLADFGRFALITGAAQALALLVGFQTWQVVVRYGVDHRTRGDVPALGRLYRACVFLDLLTAVIGVAAAAAILAIWREPLGIGPELMRDTIVFVVAQLISVRSAAIGIARLSDRFGQAAAADSVTPLLRFLGSICAAFLMPTLQAFLWTWAAAEIATAAAYALLLLRNGDAALIWTSRLHLKQLGDENPHLVRFLVSSNAVSTLGLATKQLPILLVGGHLGPAAAGAFRLALQVAQALAKLGQLVSRAAFPEIVRAVREVAPKNLARVLGRLFWISSAGALAILIAVAAVGKPMLVAIGGNSHYAAAFPVLLWLAAAGAVDLAVLSFEPILLAANRSGTATVARVLGLAAQMALTLVLLPRIGAAGASIGVFAASFIGAVLLGIAVVRYARQARTAHKAAVA